jgi:hypothetical protein
MFTRNESYPAGKPSRETPGDRRRVIWIVVACLLFCPADTSPVRAQDWHPPEPSRTGTDWVQLSSGEWIGGSIDLFRDLEMAFDSDDLDDLVIDWSDIAAFRSPHILTFVFTKERVVTGTSSMKDGIIRVTTESGIQEFPRSDLLSIIEGSPKEINFWSVKASIGITARAGNTDQQDMNTIVRIKREATRSRTNISYQGNFGEVGGERTIDNHLGNIDFNIFISRRVFVTPAAFEYYADRFQNVDYRATIGAGGGYYFFRQGNIHWSVGLGGGYQVTRYSSVEEGQDRKSETGTVNPSTVFESDVTNDIELDFNYTSNISVPDPKSTTHHLTGLLTVDFLRDIFELSTSFTWDRVENPKAREDGTVPRRNDYRLAFGFAVDL